MNSLTFTLIVTALFVIGLVLTGWGLFNAVITTQRDLITAKERISTLERLEAKHGAEQRALEDDLEVQRASFYEALGREPQPDDHKRWQERRQTRLAVLSVQHRDEYTANDLTPATWNNIGRLAQYESQWVIQRLIDSNKGNLVLLGSGIVVTTIASIWSLFI